MRETQELKDFSISTWFENFKSVSIKTIIIHLPQHICQIITDSDTSVDLEEACSTELINELKNALNTLQKNAFVKNNWHAPTDAKMFSFGNTLKDDFASIKGVPFCIALKEWKNIHPAAEFRCIVIHNVLRGITPRDWPTFYPHFKEEGPEIINKITEFYNANIKSKFARENYVFDIVISYPERPYVIDFSPLNSKTNLYAFSWKEIQPLLNKESLEVPPVFRYLESDIGIMTKADALYKISQSNK